MRFTARFESFFVPSAEPFTAKLGRRFCCCCWFYGFCVVVVVVGFMGFVLLLFVCLFVWNLITLFCFACCFGWVLFVISLLLLSC